MKLSLPSLATLLSPTAVTYGAGGMKSCSHCYIGILPNIERLDGTHLICVDCRDGMGGRRTSDLRLNDFIGTHYGRMVARMYGFEQYCLIKEHRETWYRPGEGAEGLEFAGRCNNGRGRQPPEYHRSFANFNDWVSNRGGRLEWDW